MSRHATSLCDLPRWAVRRTGDLTMPLHLSMIHSAVRISSFGDLAGTGFIVTVGSETIPGERYGYVITAHHVIDTGLGFEVQVPNPFANGELYPPVPVSDWRQPLSKVDLAVAPFPAPDDRNYQAIDVEDVLPVDRRPRPRLGEQIYYIGIFEPLLRPMARSGTIGALEQSGIPHRGDYKHESDHLVDCRSYSGFSGSPCFAVVPFAQLDQPPPLKLAETQRLADVNHWAAPCGMFTAHYSDEETEDAKGVVSRYGVGVMLPSSEIRRALMTDGLRNERREWDAERTEAKKRDQPTLRNAGFREADQGEDEFKRFEDLTRKLVSVPKKDLDKKRDAEG